MAIGPGPARVVLLASLVALGEVARGGRGPARDGTTQTSIPIRLHTGAGWGMPAADERAAYYLTKRHELVSVERTERRVRWARALGTETAVPAGMTVSLAGPLVVAGDYDLFAFDRWSGDERWRFSPAVGYGVGHYLGDTSRGQVLAGSPSSRAYAVDSLTGRLRWMSEPIGNRATVFPPVAGSGGVVAGYTDYSATPKRGGVVMLDAATGALRWRAVFPPQTATAASGLAGGPVVVADLVLAAASDGAVYAFDAATGAIRWTLAAIHLPHAGPGPPGEDFRAMTVRGRMLILGSTTGSLSAIDLDTRQETWRFSSPRHGSIGFHIRSDDEVVYVPYLSGHLVAVSLATGRELWRTGGPDLPFLWPPGFGPRGVFLTTESGLYAISR